MGGVFLDSEVFQRRLRDLQLTALGPYVRSTVHLRFRCHVCKSVFSKEPRDISRGCPVCNMKSGIERRATSQRLTQLEYRRRLRRVTYDMRVLETYVNIDTDILHRCLICGYEKKYVPWVLLKGHGCFNCGRKKTSKNGFRLKDYQLGKRTVRVQGFEHLGLDYIQSEWSIRPKHIRVDIEDNVPMIEYRFSGRSHRHYPDIWIPHLNRLVEVKSEYTFGKSGSSYRKRVLAKKRAALAAGYEYVILVMSPDGSAEEH